MQMVSHCKVQPLPSFYPKPNKNSLMPSSKNTTRILIIDDDEDDYFITSQYLHEIQSMNISSSWCYNIRDAQEKLLREFAELGGEPAPKGSGKGLLGGLFGKKK